MCNIYNITNIYYRYYIIYICIYIYIFIYLFWDELPAPSHTVHSYDVHSSRAHRISWPNNNC